MILNSRETCIAYRCPYCTSGVKSMVGVFSLSGSMKKLKCDCGASELTITHTNDGKLRITVPCLFCQHDHTFTISSKLFFDKELFIYPCPYSGIDLVFLGTPAAVEKALEKSEQALLEMLKEAGIDDIDALHESLETANPYDDEIDGRREYDPSIYDAIMFVIRDLMEAGEISCCCDDGEYDVAVSDDHVKVYCKSCGASKDIPTDSEIFARSFMEVHHLKLERL
ncbi:MAG: hypothetical protein HFE63_03240 [Clostridiales bacterium]|nr:hypothetical protein [Clostridiales bacterium]